MFVSWCIYSFTYGVYVSVHVCINICMYINIYIYVSICIRIHIYVHIRIYICIYIYIYISISIYVYIHKKQYINNIYIYISMSFPAQNGECFENVRDKSHSLDDREHGCPILSQPEGTECASQRRAIYRCDFPRIAAGKTIFLHLGPPQRSPHRR